MFKKELHNPQNTIVPYQMTRPKTTQLSRRNQENNQNVVGNRGLWMGEGVMLCARRERYPDREKKYS